MGTTIPNLTIRSAAEKFGVSERTIRRRIASGELPAYRLGPRSIRLRAEDVEALAKPIPAGGDAA